MRKAVRRMLSPLLRRESATASDIEEHLRTYMVNGTDPDELHLAADAFATEDHKAFQEHQRVCEKRRAALAKVMIK